MAPIVNERQAANVEPIVTETIAKGAKVLTGGSRKGLFFEQTSPRPSLPNLTPITD